MCEVPNSMQGGLDMMTDKEYHRNEPVGSICSKCQFNYTEPNGSMGCLALGGSSPLAIAEIKKALTHHKCEIFKPKDKTK